MKNIEQINVLNMFHDGTITQLIERTKTISMEIEIEYLAKLINKNFTSFICEFINYEEINFKFWEENDFTVIDSELLKKYELEIIEAEEIDNKVVLKCLSKLNTGGNFYIQTETIKIYDQEKQEISISKLAEVSHQYWNTI
ncbi:hypothetical protein [Gottfriedia solisilvae]|uniref:Uncharacterized protein n=1 Tax=Gottfriedia solisilvae TaxID=1516104 RepID=A0A8J3AER1_9BACI|nr:hypothetical protein [Gottfriedia solisilvae]GGI12973.1 hypothetical protein GCM10007380_15590 [Gottfriedia solisilvae]